VREAINAWLSGLVSGAVGPAVQTAGALMDPARLTDTGALHQLWADSRAIANTLFVLFVLAGAVMVLGFETVQSRYAIKQIAPRLVMGWLAANLSWPLITTATQLAAGLAVAVAGTTVHPADILSQLVVAATSDGPTFMVILAGVVAVLALVLTLTLIVITALLLGLTALAPLALCLHALPHTEAIAWCWWRAFTGALSVPTLHALLLALLARVLLTPGGLAVGVFGLPIGPLAPGSLLNMLVVIALLYLMIKIPGWVLRGATGAAGRRGGLLRGLLSSVVLTAGLGALGVPIPAAGLASRGVGLLGSRSGLAALGLRAATSARRPTSTPTTTATATSTRSARGSRTAAPPSARPARTRGGASRAAPASGAPAHADPYVRVQVARGGQLLLPLPGLTHRRPTPPPAGTPRPPRHSPASPAPATAATAGGSGQRRVGRQLSLPLGTGWPEHRPVLGRDGQYRLPIRAPRTAQTPPAQSTPARSTTSAARPGAGGADRRPPWEIRRPGPGQLPLPLIWPPRPRRPAQHAGGHPPAPSNPTHTGNGERGLS
jgi:hypothetical protein